MRISGDVEILTHVRGELDDYSIPVEAEIEVDLTPEGDLSLVVVGDDRRVVIPRLFRVLSEWERYFPLDDSAIEPMRLSDSVIIELNGEQQPIE